VDTKCIFKRRAGCKALDDGVEEEGLGEEACALRAIGSRPGVLWDVRHVIWQNQSAQLLVLYTRRAPRLQTCDKNYDKRYARPAAAGNIF